VDDDEPVSRRKDAIREASHFGSPQQPIDLEADNEGAAKPGTNEEEFLRTAAQTQFGEPSTSGRESADREASKMAESLKAFANRASTWSTPWNQPPKPKAQPASRPGQKSFFSTPPTKRAPPKTNKTSPMYSKRAPPRYAQQARIDSMLNKAEEEIDLEAAWAAADGLGDFRDTNPKNDSKLKLDSGEALRKAESGAKAAQPRAAPLPTGPPTSRGGSAEPEKRAGSIDADVERTRPAPMGAPKVPRAPPSAPRKTIRIELAGEGQTASARARMRR
jgi:hypothetical protein